MYKIRKTVQQNLNLHPPLIAASYKAARHHLPAVVSF